LEDAPSLDGAALGAAVVVTTADEAGTLEVVGAGGEEEARFSFQKLEDELVVPVVSGLTTSHVSDEVEAFEGSRWSQVALLLFAGFSVSAALGKLGVLCSTVGLSLTVALRVIAGFFFSLDFSLDLVSSGSSDTSCLSRPTIHHNPEDFL
jgi:hypothetical protein